MKRVVVNDEQQLLKELETLNTTLISWDTETTGLEQYSLEMTGMSICDGNKVIYIVIDSSINYNSAKALDISVVSSYLKDFFSRVKAQICHNWVFDARVLYKHGVDVRGIKYFDTAVAAHLIDENQEKALKSLASKLLNVEVTTFKEVGQNHYNKDFYEYGLDDASYTYDLYQLFEPQIYNKKLEYLMFKIEMPYQLCLFEMAIEGVLVDKNLMNFQSKALKKAEEDLIVQMCDNLKAPYEMQFTLDNNVIMIPSINFNSSHQLIKVFGEQGIEIIEKTDTGNPSVGKKTLQDNKDHPFVNLLIRYKIVSKLLAGFINPLPGQIQGDGKVRPSFNDTGARTGRLSCSKPNLQQLPKPKCYSCGSPKVKEGMCESCNKKVDVNVRSIFRAPKGYKMFSADYKSQEICVMAQQSKDPTLIKSLHNGYDMHLAIANKFYNLGIPEECLSEEHKDHKVWKEKFSNERGKAKTITFGLAFGKGAYGFSKDFGITEDEAQKIVDDYFEGMPKLKEAIDVSHKEIKKNGFVRNLAGRYRHFEKNTFGHYSNRDLRQGFNFKIQGFAADMIRAASINVYKRNIYKAWDLKQIMTVHDENIYVVKEQYLKEAEILVKKAFEDVGNKFVVPLVAEIERGDNYGEAK